MVKVVTLVAGAALLIGLSAPALAETVMHRGHVVRHRVHSRTILVRRRPIEVVGPAKFVPLGPDEFVDPANPGYVRGVDDGSRYDTAADGVAVGQEGTLLPRPGSNRAYVRSGRSFELEAPPISAALPVVPELINPELY